MLGHTFCRNFEHATRIAAIRRNIEAERVLLLSMALVSQLAQLSFSLFLRLPCTTMRQTMSGDSSPHSQCSAFCLRERGLGTSLEGGLSNYSCVY
jgi:hypothetical protein